MASTHAAYAFREVAEAADLRIRASMLVQFSKDYDLREPACRGCVDTISSWIGSDDPELRRAVVFALCFFRPIPGLQRVIEEGWRRAPVGDLHWYAGAVESACSQAEQVSRELICVVTSTLLAPPPPQPEDTTSLGALEVWKGYRMARSEAARALRHLASVALPEHAWTPEAEIDWECVARLLHWSCRCRPTGGTAPSNQ